VRARGPEDAFEAANLERTGPGTCAGHGRAVIAGKLVDDAWQDRRRRGRSGGVAGKAGKLGLGFHALEDAAGFVARLPDAPKGAALAAHVSSEGHWTFVSKQGDSFTAAYPHEMERLRGALAPDLPADGRLALYLSEETAFANPGALASLPAHSELHVVAGRDSFPLVRGSEAAPLKAQVRPNLTIEMTSREAFGEAVFLIGRPLNKSNVRMLSIEPGGPKSLPSTPMFDKTDKTTLVDRIDASAVLGSFGKIRGQTVLVTGRPDGDALYVAASGQASDALSISKLREAAQSADVNLVILESASHRQPGGRNWLWQKVEVAGLNDALKQTTYADFFNALGANRAPLSITAIPDNMGHTLLQALPPPTPSGSLTGGYGPWAGDVADELAGRIAVHSVSALVRDKSSEQERDARFIPGIASWIQITVLANIVTGLLAYQISWPWWSKIWPPESRGEYGVALGYHAARLIRGLAYVFIFLTLTGLFAFCWLMLLNLWEAVLLPFRWMGWAWGKLVPGKSA